MSIGAESGHAVPVRHRSAPRVIRSRALYARPSVWIRRHDPRVTRGDPGSRTSYFLSFFLLKKRKRMTLQALAVTRVPRWQVLAIDVPFRQGHSRVVRGPERVIGAPNRVIRDGPAIPDRLSVFLGVRGRRPGSAAA